MNFLANHKLAVVLAAAAAAQTALESDVVDMKGFDGATFVGVLGDVTATCVLTLTIQHGDLADGSDMVNTAIAATFVAGASDADSAALAVEGFHPTKRFCRAVLTRTTANAAVNSIVCIQSQPKTAPVTQDASIIASDFGTPVLA